MTYAELYKFDVNNYPQVEPQADIQRSLSLQIGTNWRKRAWPLRWLNISNRHGNNQWKYITWTGQKTEQGGMTFSNRLTFPDPFCGFTIPTKLESTDQIQMVYNNTSAGLSLGIKFSTRCSFLSPADPVDRVPREMIFFDFVDGFGNPEPAFAFILTPVSWFATLPDLPPWSPPTL